MLPNRNIIPQPNDCFAFIQKLLYNEKTDIQTLGMVIYYILTKGMHPFGKKSQDICNNKKFGRKCILLENAEHYQLVRHCLSKRASKRPHIEIVSQ